MTLPSMSSPALYHSLSQIIGLSARTKSLAQLSLASLQTTSVTADWVFEFLNGANNLINNFNLYKSTAGIDAYAQTQLPGYVGTISNDVTAVVNAIQACIDWVVTNFPKDSTNTYILAYTALAANGTKSPRLFAPAQTGGLQTNLQSLIALIS